MSATVREDKSKNRNTQKNITLNLVKKLFKITVIHGKTVLETQAEKGTRLSDVLIKNKTAAVHPCGCNGSCKKCTVNANGKTVLSCRYIIEADTKVIIPEKSDVLSPSADDTQNAENGEMFFALDIGTTTVALALCSHNTGNAVFSAVFDNPQRIFGADVISRISYCTKNGTDELSKILIGRLNSAVADILAKAGKTHIKKLYAAGNTTMLHLFLNADVSLLGIAPYKPVFLESKELNARELGIENIDTVITLPSISSFFGADAVSGMLFCRMPEKGKYNLLVDLGTNAEISLYSPDKILCTSAAAGPCFEGANISCGMSAVNGALYSYKQDGTFDVFSGDDPEGICATGLIDLIAVLLKKGIIDSTGLLAGKEFEITESVKLTQEDVRQFQLAKSAVFSAIKVLTEKAGVNYGDIENFFVAGGFSSKMNIDNAVMTGLFPAELKEKFKPVNNSSLKGVIKYVCENADIFEYTKNSNYIDLSSDKDFADLFIMNMMFGESE